MPTHHATTPYSVLLGEKGRVVLPAEVREGLGLEIGQRLLLSVEPDGTLRLVPARTAVARLRGLFADRVHGRSLSRELLAERRREARRENRRD